MTNLIARFVKDRSGATAIEYGLIAAGIALAIITIVNTLGVSLRGPLHDDQRPAQRRSVIRSVERLKASVPRSLFLIAYLFVQMS